VICRQQEVLFVASLRARGVGRQKSLHPPQADLISEPRGKPGSEAAQACSGAYPGLPEDQAGIWATINPG
jgi:hypothetical protein